MPVLTIDVGPAAPPASAVADGWRVTAPDTFALSHEDTEDIRWYLEDYLGFPDDPAPQIAARVEQRLRAVGEALFRSVFEGDPARSWIWDSVSGRLAEIRVEIRGAAGVSEVIPFELMCAPGQAMRLALAAQTFVRVPGRPAQVTADELTLPLRVLLVICRPEGEEDVPFHSVGGAVVRTDTLIEDGLISVDVLRPPFAGALAPALRQAKESGRPYHVVHIDAHGVFDDLERRGTARGYVLFENPYSDDNASYMNGSVLGRCLVAGTVPVAIINACRSGHAQARPAPRPEASSQPRAFGSLAREIADAGVPGVVAMRYSVYTATAARFVAAVYAGLTGGLSLGEAVRLGRTDLAAQPLRRAGFANCRLEDWCVPVVLEQGPVRLCAPAPVGDQARQKPARPSRGTPFVGRDETLLRLDRAFDSSHAVLLSGEIGSGKSACVEAFGRWYRMTGGCTELRRVSARDESPDATLTKLEADIDAHTPPPGLLWTIDDVDYVDGFPVRPVSRWKGRHRNRLRNWLLRARAAKIKVLLVGRRRRQDWAGAPPTTVVMRPLNEQDRAELLLQHRPVAEAPLDWTPLTTASDGNPQMLLSLLAAVVPDVAAGVQDIGPIVEAIVAGERPFAPNDTLLPALLDALSGDVAGKHGTVLSALHLFRTVVSAADLHVMGMPGLDWQLVELAAAGRDQTVAKTVLQALADRGLLRPFAKDWCRMHPALPAVLRDSFIRDYPDDRAGQAERSYVYGCADFANHSANFIIQGSPWLFGLREHLPNLQRAWQIAVARGWLDQAVHLMQGLEEVLRADHRLAAFKRLVDEIEPLISTPTGPHPQWRAEWRIVQEYKARLAATDRTFYSEEETAAALAALTPETPDSDAELAWQNYAVGLSEQGLHLLQRGDPAGLTLIDRSLDIARVRNDTSGQITSLIQLGTGYAQIEPNDTDKAVALLEEAVTKAAGDEYGRLRLIALHTLTEVLIARVKELSMQRVSGRALTPLMEKIFANLTAAEPLVLNAHSAELSLQQAGLLGEALLLDWKYQDAIDAFNTAIQLSAGDPITIAKCRMMIALCLKLLGRTEAALEYERSARTLAEQHGFALNVSGVAAGRC